MKNMPTTTLSSKGQLVIPKAVREHAQVDVGDIFSVRYVNGEIRFKRIPARSPSTLKEVAGCLKKPDRTVLSEAKTRAIIGRRLKAKHTP